MSFKGLHRDAQYGLVHKDVVLFGTLSLKARGLYALLSCWPVEERLSVSAVLRVVPDGREAVTNAWRELQKHGYITTKGRKEKPRSLVVSTKNKPPKQGAPRKESSQDLRETTNSQIADPIVGITQELNLEENTTNDRATQFRKTSIGNLESFMALKVARDADAAGIDVAHYFNAILEWSNKKNRQLRTAHGWVDTVKGAIRRDKDAGKLKMKGQNEAQQEDQLRFLQLGRE